MKIPLSIKSKRDINAKSCDGCTKCCEGWLSAEINGEPMYPGKPCLHVNEGVGCNIYKDRPVEPCRNFECFWKASKIMPMEFKPSEVGVIISNQQINRIPYLLLSEAGNTVPANVLSWFLQWIFTNQLNAQWQIGETFHAFGSNEFLAALARREAAHKKDK